jgi:hypothetical protein
MHVEIRLDENRMIALGVPKAPVEEIISGEGIVVKPANGFSPPRLLR